MQTKAFTFFLSIILLLTFAMPNTVDAQDDNDKFVVVLDAGHGGKDHGKPAKYGDSEKDIALKIVLALGKQLENNKDIKVVYTRKTDVFIGLAKRGQIANKANADLFVSVHCNAHTSQAHGSETYVLGIHRNETNFNVAKAENQAIFYEEDYEKTYKNFNPNSAESFIGLTMMQEAYLDQSIQLAKNIQDNFTKKLNRKNRGVKQAGFVVLHQTVMPSVLIETGFITNTNERKYLNSNKGQTEMALAITNAIKKYKKSVEASFTEEAYQPIVETPVITEQPIKERIIENTTFKIQIAASKRKLKIKPYNFKGLSNISREKQKKIYKYYYGSTSDYNMVEKLKNEAKKKGYESCFVVAFKDGKQIKVADALKSP